MTIKTNITSLLSAFVMTAMLVIAPGSFAGEPSTVNINSASAKELAKTLDGIGKSRAAAIVAFREANGRFTSADDLLLIDGIGVAIIGNNKEKIATQ